MWARATTANSRLAGLDEARHCHSLDSVLSISHETVADGLLDRAKPVRPARPRVCLPRMQLEWLLSSWSSIPVVTTTVPRAER